MKQDMKADLGKSRTMIELRGVEKRFQHPSGLFTALAGIDLTIEKGSYLAVVGKSGSGKSTLLNMVAGIDRPSNGEVLVKGLPVHRLSEGKLAVWRGRNIGIVFQFFQLLPTLTVVENVLLPMDFVDTIPSKERLSRAMTLLERVGLVSHAKKLPSDLSGGEQQRVAIARATANDPSIVIADEPTGNLDSVTSESVLSVFKDLVEEGKTVIIVTHDRDAGGKATHTVRLADGYKRVAPFSRSVTVPAGGLTVLTAK